MRFMSIPLWALMVLVSLAPAHAQTPGSRDTTSDQMERSVSPSSLPAPSDAADLTRSLQAELKRVGCFEGIHDGAWDGKTKSALQDFARRSKLDVRTDEPTWGAIEALKSRRDRVCPLECGAGRVEQNGQCVAKAAPAVKAPPPPAAREVKRAPREKPEAERSNSGGMCWRDDGRGQSLVPCSEAPVGRRAY